MPKTQKILTIGLWCLAVVAMVALVASGMLRRQHPDELNAGADQLDISKPLFAVPAFSLLDQNGKPFSLDDLKGHVWVADFIFTRCSGPCPIMTSRMARMQQALGDSPVRLVSFSVDPEHDTPEVLKAYGERFGVDDARWKLATGPRSTIDELAVAMKVGRAGGSGPMQHSTYFILVDRDGMIRAFFGGQEEQGWQKAAAAAQRLASEK